MGSDVRHVRGEAQKELVKKFEVFTSKGRSRWQVWSDWITISAIAVSNATDKSHFDEREQQYMTIVKKYTKQEVDAFADMFSILVMALEDNSEQDFLGELYMCLGLGSDQDVYKRQVLPEPAGMISYIISLPERRVVRNGG